MCTLSILLLAGNLDYCVKFQVHAKVERRVKWTPCVPITQLHDLPDRPIVFWLLTFFYSSTPRLFWSKSQISSYYTLKYFSQIVLFDNKILLFYSKKSPRIKRSISFVRLIKCSYNNISQKRGRILPSSFQKPLNLLCL